jgi:ribosome maturation factor RimP
MAIQMDAIRALAVRVAASHHLEVVDVEFSGGGKFRALRVFLEKDAAERAKLKALAEADAELDLPKDVPVEMLSGVTHEDCAAFAQDFGTLLDVEDVIPGAEYTLEVSSPGLERKLYKADDYQRFVGSLIKLQTFTPVVVGEGKGNRQWQGRLAGFADGMLTLDLAAVKQKGKPKKSSAAAQVQIALANVEKANLVAEI